MVATPFSRLFYLALTKLCLLLTVKITGKLQDGTVFTKKGHDEEPFEFRTDEGKNSCLSFMSVFSR